MASAFSIGSECRYTVWYETTTPDGDYRLMQRGIYATVEEAQIGLKFNLKGGEYKEIIMEGKDVTPSFQGTLRVCHDVKVYAAHDDDPSRLYIWTKDLAGNTERLRVGVFSKRAGAAIPLRAKLSFSLQLVNPMTTTIKTTDSDSSDSLMNVTSEKSSQSQVLIDNLNTEDEDSCDDARSVKTAYSRFASESAEDSICSPIPVPITPSCASKSNYDNITDSTLASPSASSQADSGISTPLSVETTLTTPSSTPALTLDGKSTHFEVNSKHLTARLLDVGADGGIVLIPAIGDGSFIDSEDEAGPVADKPVVSRYLLCPSPVLSKNNNNGKMASYRQEDIVDPAYDASGEEESDTGESMYGGEWDASWDSTSIRGVKDGWIGYASRKQNRKAAVKNLLTILRRLSRREAKHTRQM